MSINVTVQSGVVRKVFDKKTLESGTDVQTFVLRFKSGDKDKDIMVSVYGDLVDELELEEETSVIVQGRLHEQNWKDKETDEWKNRHEIVASRVVNLDDLDAGPLGDDD